MPYVTCMRTARRRRRRLNALIITSIIPMVIWCKINTGTVNLFISFFVSINLFILVYFGSIKWLIYLLAQLPDAPPQATEFVVAQWRPCVTIVTVQRRCSEWSPIESSILSSFFYHSSITFHFHPPYTYHSPILHSSSTQYPLVNHQSPFIHPPFTHPSFTHHSPIIHPPSTHHPSTIHPSPTYPLPSIHPFIQHPPIIHPSSTHPSPIITHHHPSSTSHPPITHPSSTQHSPIHPASTHHPPTIHPSFTHHHPSSPHTASLPCSSSLKSSFRAPSILQCLTSTQK